MTLDARTVDLAVLNSMTKYPSIPTYHTIDPSNGTLTEPAVKFAGRVIGTEKVDGCNARVITFPDGTYVIGSREELLYARGDRVVNPWEGVVDALRPYAEDMGVADAVRAYYVEVYGGRIGGKVAKTYTANRAVGVRLFDVAEFFNYEELLAWPVERIASWRDHGWQPYVHEHRLSSYAMSAQMLRTPALFELDAADLPTGIDETREFLAAYMPFTQCALEPETAGQAEGIVMRTPDRTVIAKARFADYDRTIRRRNGTQKVKARA